jgi:hypothetical protein
LFVCLFVCLMRSAQLEATMNLLGTHMSLLVHCCIGEFYSGPNCLQPHVFFALQAANR